MGEYINPRDMGKEEWLEKHGVKTNVPLILGRVRLPVCLVDNGAFSAAGIAYSKSEVDAFGPRPRQWYSVPTDKLLEVCPGLKERLK